MPDPWLEPNILTGHHVALEPLAPGHREPLRKTARDESSWTYGPVNRDRDFESFFDASVKADESGASLTYAVRSLSDGLIVGSTRFMEIAPEHRRAEIGTTWYVPEARGTVVNPETKYLMLDFGFKAEALRIEFKTDARNAASRAALLKLGAKEEGTLRNHMLNWDGFQRSTVYFSILSDEWPDVKARLEKRLAAFG